jgi:hypothetical protein
MLPGIGDKIKEADIDERQLDRIEAMITSMTPAERAKPSIINPSRKRRIAAGSGMKVEDVNRLLKQFDQMQQMMKKFTGSGSKMNLRKARKQLAGMNFDKLTGKGGGNYPLAQSTSDSTISIADLLDLVKWDAEKYIPKHSKKSSGSVKNSSGDSKK